MESASFPPRISGAAPVDSVLLAFSNLWIVKHGFSPLDDDERFLPKALKEMNSKRRSFQWNIIVPTTDALLTDPHNLQTILFCFSCYCHGFELNRTGGSRVVTIVAVHLFHENTKVVLWMKYVAKSFLCALVMWSLVRRNVISSAFWVWVILASFWLYYENRIFAWVDSTIRLKWFQMVIWFHLGSLAPQTLAVLSLRERQKTARKMKRTSKLLNLDEFESCVPYNEVTAKRSTDSCIFVSHRWKTKHHPDPLNEERESILPALQLAQLFLDYLTAEGSTALAAIGHKVFLDPLDTEECLITFANLGNEKYWSLLFFARLQTEIFVWYDFQSVPQGKDDDSRTIRQLCLEEIAPLCRQMPVLAVPADDYLKRAWCFFECVQSCMGNFRFRSLDKARVSHVGSLPLWIVTESSYGRFCWYIEQGISPGEMMEKLGISCTNGSDLSFLTEKLVSQTAVPAGVKIETEVVVHPLEVAILRYAMNRIVLMVHEDQSALKRFSDMLSLMHYYQEHLRYCRNMRLTDSFLYRSMCVEHWLLDKHKWQMAMSQVEEESSMNMTLRWNYPSVALDYLVRSNPNFSAEFETNTNVLNEILMAAEPVVAGTDLNWESWKYCQRKEWQPIKSKLEDALGFMGSIKVRILFRNGA